MNKERRKEISKIIERLENLQSDIESIMDDEQDYYDNMPENLQCSMRGETAEEAIDNLNEAIDSISEALNSLNESTN